jgi:hypothetical protein
VTAPTVPVADVREDELLVVRSWGITTGGAAAYAATRLGLAMVAAAVVVLRRGHVTTARLRERRATLERELGERDLIAARVWQALGEPAWR